MWSDQRAHEDIKKRFDKNVAEKLKKMSYKLVQRSSIGRTDLIMVMPDKTIQAVADHMGDDAAMGY